MSLFKVLMKGPGLPFGIDILTLFITDEAARRRVV
jgi:hypothetical protein